MIVESADRIKFQHFYDVFQELKQKLGEVSYKYWIAGGAITSYFSGNQINDYDFYSNDPASFIKDMEVICGKIERTNEFSVEFNFNNKNIQITNYPYTDPIHTIYNFDYTICCISFDGNSVYRAESFWDDIHSNTIRFRKNNIHPFQAFERLIKYTKRGFNPTVDTMLRVSKDLSKYPYDWSKITTKHFRNF